MRHALLSAGLGAAGAMRVDRLVAPLAAGSGLALAFHRVKAPDGTAFAPNAALEMTPEAFRAVIETVAASGVEFIPIGAVADRLGRRRRRFAVLTFDDGSRDTLDVAAPILRAMGLPWTLFAVPGFVDRSARAWWIELERYVAVAERVAPFPDGNGRDDAGMPTRTLAAKHAAFEWLRSRLHRAPQAQREAWLAERCAASGICPKAIVADSFASRSEIASALRDDAVTLGAHTCTHPVLSRCAPAEAAAEIDGCRRKLSATFGRQVDHLAFPHGTADACGPREARLAADAGFATAWTARRDHLRAGDAASPHALPRISMHGCYAGRAMARVALSGAAFLAERMVRRPAPRRDAILP